MYNKGFSRTLIYVLSITILSSCANMQAMIESHAQEEQEISVEQKLQVSIPLPEDSKYLINKTVIFGEGNKFSGILYLQHEKSADDVANFYRKNLISDGWSEIGIVRSRFILINFEKEHRFATVKVMRTMFEKSESEITIGPKSIKKTIKIDKNK